MITLVYTYIKLVSENKIRKKLPMDIIRKIYKTLFTFFSFLLCPIKSTFNTFNLLPRSSVIKPSFPIFIKLFLIASVCSPRVLNTASHQAFY